MRFQLYLQLDEFQPTTTEKDEEETFGNRTPNVSNANDLVDLDVERIAARRNTNACGKDDEEKERP